MNDYNNSTLIKLFRIILSVFFTSLMSPNLKFIWIFLVFILATRNRPRKLLSQRSNSKEYLTKTGGLVEVNLLIFCTFVVPDIKLTFLKMVDLQGHLYFTSCIRYVWIIALLFKSKTKQIILILTKGKIKWKQTQICIIRNWYLFIFFHLFSLNTFSIIIIHKFLFAIKYLHIEIHKFLK